MEDLRNKAVEQFQGISAPGFNTEPYSVYKNPRTYQPQGYNVANGQASVIETDPYYRQAKLDAINQMKSGLPGASGFSQAQQSQLGALRNAQLKAGNTANKALESQMLQRGQGGSGNLLAMRLANNAQAAEGANELGEALFRSAGDQQLQREAAIANTVGNYAAQDASVATQQAALTDLFNRTMLQLQTQANRDNSNWLNQAQMYNAQTRDAIDRANVDIGNKNLDRGNTLKQSDFDNAMTLASARANAYNALMASVDRQRAADQQHGADMLGLGLSAAGSVFGGPIGGAVGGVLGSVFDDPSVICSELFRQRLLPRNLYLADNVFGIQTYITDPALIVGYWHWAKPVVRKMKKSKRLSKLLSYAVKPWAQEMAYQMGYEKKGSVVGKLVQVIMHPICRTIGKRVMAAQKVEIEKGIQELVCHYFLANAKTMRMI